MSPILKLDHDDPEKELAFELDYQLSLTTRERVEMMLRRSDEVRRTLIQHGHRKPVEIIKRDAVDFASLDNLIEMKRAAGGPKDLEDVKVLLELKRRRDAKGRE